VYTKCEKELRKKTEESIKLKIEINDLKQILKLGQQLDQMDVSVEEIQEEEIHLSKMKSSGFRRRSPQVEASPMKSSPIKASSPKASTRKATGKSKPNEAEFNCNDCFFQGTSENEVNKQINIQHRKGVILEGPITCKNCGERFETKRNLLHHRKSKHLNLVAFCRNNLEGKCDFTDDMCWWNHSEKRDESIVCYICSKNFETKSHMMTHRRIDHKHIVQK
jgi:transcription elongation factor Elf1